jgi:hypothetical protein
MIDGRLGRDALVACAGVSPSGISIICGFVGVSLYVAPFQTDIS